MISTRTQRLLDPSSLKTLGRVFLALLMALTLCSPAMAQGRKKKKKKKPKSSKTSSKKSYPKATIVRERGRLIKDVTIRSFKFDKVEYRPKGSRRNEELKGEKIVRIQFADAPPDFSSGVSRVRAGLYKRAIESFDKALGDAEDGDWVWFYCTFWRGEAKLLLGDGDGAVSDFQAVLDKDKEHFLAPNALYGMGRAQTLLKSTGKAKAAYATLSEGFGSLWGARAKLGLGDAHLADNDPQGATAAYNLAAARAQDRDLRRAAEVGMGRCWVKRKNYAKAISIFQKIMEEVGIAPEVAATAWVGKGDCLYEQAKEGGDDKELFKKALIAYQTCVVRFAGVPESYPKALYRSADLYEKLGQPKLAGLQKKELKSRCPNSPWTAKLN